MRRVVSFTITDCGTAGRRLVFCFMAVLMAPGCRHDAEIEFISTAKPPKVRLVQPQARTIVRVVGQPSFIESYERTSIYPKPTAYIKKWVVDIGDKVKKVDVLATLFAPELVEELGTKKATVVLDRERIALAKEVVEVARADVTASEEKGPLVYLAMNACASPTPKPGPKTEAAVASCRTCWSWEVSPTAVFADAICTCRARYSSRA